MDEHVLAMLSGDASKYPHALEQHYGRILKKIVSL